MHSTEFLALARYADDNGFSVVSFDTINSNPVDHSNTYAVVFMTDTRSTRTANVTITDIGFPTPVYVTDHDATDAYDLHISWTTL